MQTRYPTSFRRHMGGCAHLVMKRAAFYVSEAIAGISLFAMMLIVLPVLAACFHI